MKILFIHPNFPGQYKHLARVLAANPDNEVVFLSKPKAGASIPGVKRVEYTMNREAQPETHRYIIGFERAVFQGQEVWRVCKKMKQAGFTPDVICCHPGWGDGLFLKDIYPDASLLNYMEFYYRAFGADVHFDPKEPINADDVTRIRVKNSTNLLNLDSCDWGISPTYWQMSQHPKEFQSKISVIHEGIDTEMIAPREVQEITLPNGTKLKKGDEIVTYVCRNFEPYRGFPTVMRAIDILTKERPNCHVLIVGNDGVSYGRNAEGKTYKQQMLEELNLDLSRVHFIPTLPYDQYLKILQYSSAHIYYTVPFVLSWSALEAMASGCLMVASNTPPVLEVIQDGYNGLIADFFSPQDLARRITEALVHPNRMQPLRQQARKTIVDHYSLNTLMPLHLSLIQDLAQKRLPPPTANRVLELHEQRKAA